MKKIGILIVWLAIQGCSKTEFLNKKPDNSLVVPTTLDDCQQLLDRDLYMNGNSSVLGWKLSDDFLFEEKFVQEVTPEDLAVYRFEVEPFPTGISLDWNLNYVTVFYANQVLDILSRIQPLPVDQARAGQLRGAALFYRAFAYADLLNVFAKPFDAATAATDPGIILREGVDVSEKLTRSSIADAHKLIEENMQEAINLLPINEVYPTRPTRTAAHAFLARWYLAKREYEKAYKYADSCLQVKSELMDFNTLTRIPTFNAEVIFHANQRDDQFSLYSSIHPDILAAYEEGDRRNTDLFLYASQGSIGFMGSYTGTSYRFSGLAVDEVLLIRAECAARQSNIDLALQDLNFLLSKRMNPASFHPVEITDPEELLDRILLERRKELLFRGLRNTDIRRLNQEGREIVVQRVFNGINHTLSPNSLLQVMPIPRQVIQNFPDMEQNPR